MKVETPIDGISILPELLRSNDAAKEAVDMETAPPLERYFYFTWRGDGGRFKPIKDPFIKRNGPGYTIRWGNWKGMVPHCWDQDLFKPTRRDRMRLFDLKADPLETTDVAKTKPEIVELLMNLVLSQNLSCLCYQCPWPRKPRRTGANKTHSSGGSEKDEKPLKLKDVERHWVVCCALMLFNRFDCVDEACCSLLGGI